MVGEKGAGDCCRCGAPDESALVRANSVPGIASHPALQAPGRPMAHRFA